MRPTLSALWLACSVWVAQAVDLTGYEYIVVGSGPGGGPLAARLALAGRKTLLIDAGNDQGANYNYSVPAYHALASEDPDMAWNFFVRHYADDKQQARDFKTTYDTPGGGTYTGLNPPAGSKIRGVLYPRTGALGGCSAHNAQIQIYPFRSDFDRIAQLTGDSSWSATNMRNQYVKLEDNHHLLPLKPGHGYSGWLGVNTASIGLVLQDTSLLSLVLGGGFALGNLTSTIFNLVTLLAGDLNSNSEDRDKKAGFFQVPLTTTGDGVRNGAREFVLSVRDAKNSDGSKKYPLDVRLNCHVTKVVFDKSVNPPRATGVEFLDGAHLYRASPRSARAAAGVKGTAKASREVIVSGGSYNTPQILKLSGVGPAEELNKFGIPVIANRPGVGTNLQDRYEVVVGGELPANLSLLDGCTFSTFGQADPCLERWKQPNLLGDRGVYQTSGATAAMVVPSTQTQNGDFDLFIFGSPAKFTGYFPGYSVDALAEKDRFTWIILKAQTRNKAGAVTLRSADPLDVPDIQFNYFADGANEDLQAVYEGLKLGREAFARQFVDVTEQIPGEKVQSEADLKKYIRDTAWGHHASSTCPIGTDSDPMAVLDSKFRVRGVQGLRVVDASVFPSIPGTFIAAAIYTISEKAALDILADVK
ncbi:Oxygen-dependent choline dehydrogenase [Paramyrothecium foliicola]|nr:Oxygen-dependent choline dehydrogenase [Paramyrothecium foliicola]